MRYLLGIGIIALACSLIAHTASADGALAMGSTGNVIKDGVAFGYVTDEPSAKAGSRAMELCRTYKRALKAAAQCRLVGIFKNKCFAISMDPKDQTPGVGWAIADTKAEADRQALVACRATAGDRRDQCVIDTSKCDGSK